MTHTFCHLALLTAWDDYVRRTE